METRGRKQDPFCVLVVDMLRAWLSDGKTGGFHIHVGSQAKHMSRKLRYSKAYKELVPELLKVGTSIVLHVKDDATLEVTCSSSE